jgi:hypothetical protein
MNASISRVSRPTRIAARLRETSGQPATPPVRPSTSGSRLLQAGARRPLATFLLLGFSLAYALAFLWGLAYHGVILGGGLAAALHVAPDELTGGALVLSLFPAALFVTWARNGRLGVRRLFRRAFNWRVSPGWWLTVLFGLPTLTVTLALLMGDQLRSIDVPSFLASQLMLLIVTLNHAGSDIVSIEILLIRHTAADRGLASSNGAG